MRRQSRFLALHTELILPIFLLALLVAALLFVLSARPAGAIMQGYAIQTGSEAPPGTFLLDNFTEAATTTLDLHAPDTGAGSWVGEAGLIPIVYESAVGDWAITAPLNDTVIAWNDTDAPSAYTVSIIGRFIGSAADTDRYGPALYTSDDGGGIDTYYTRIEGDGGVATYKVVNAGAAVSLSIGGTITNFAANKLYRMTMSISNGTITVTVYDVADAEAVVFSGSNADSAITSGYAGVYLRRANNPAAAPVIYAMEAEE